MSDDCHSFLRAFIDMRTQEKLSREANVSGYLLYQKNQQPTPNQYAEKFFNGFKELTVNHDFNITSSDQISSFLKKIKNSHRHYDLVTADLSINRNYKNCLGNTQK